MLTHVKDLQEALARFNPDAYLEPTLDVQGISPATECNVTTLEFRGQKAPEEQIEELEEQIESLEDELGDKEQLLETIYTKARDAKIKKDWSLVVEIIELSDV